MKLYTLKYIPFVFLMALLSACQLSKDISLPTDDLPQAYENRAATDDTLSIASLPWHNFYADSSLLQLIDKAMQQNIDLQIALKNINATAALYRQAKWNYAPDLKLQLGAGSNRPSDNSLNGISAQNFLGTAHIEDFTASFGFSWEADIWGKIKNQKKAALAAYLQTEEARRVIQTNIVAQVASAYYNLLVLDEQIRVAKKNITLNDSTVEMIQLQFNAGQISSLAVAQAKAQQLAATQLIPQIEQRIYLQEHALHILLGEFPGHMLRNSQLADISVDPDLAAGVPASLLSVRPDVRVAALSLKIANAKVGISKASMYPALSITAASGINSFKANNWFTIPASLFGQAAGNLLLPILNKKQLRTQYKIAQIDREKTVLQFRQTVLTAVGEVSDALVQLEKLDEQYKIAALQVQTLQQATASTSLLFESGMANYLEVITAQASVLQSELGITNIRHDQLMATIALYRSLGGGWQ